MHRSFWTWKRAEQKQNWGCNEEECGWGMLMHVVAKHAGAEHGTSMQNSRQLYPILPIQSKHVISIWAHLKEVHRKRERKRVLYHQLADNVACPLE